MAAALKKAAGDASLTPRDAKTARPHVRMAMSEGSCYLFASHPMVCPLCRVTVPAKTEHQCEAKRHV